MNSRAKERIINFSWWLGIIATGLVLYRPFCTFQLHLAQGDHGNNLYVFRRTMQGAVPYRDYWWVYGPLMPYFYAAWFAALGVTIRTILIAYHFLEVLSGFFFYAAFKQAFPRYLAFTAAVYYWICVSPFEHTYNHVGAVLMSVGALYALLAYWRTGRVAGLYGGLLFLFIASLIKLNMGLALLLAYVTCVVLIDRIKEELPAPQGPVAADKKRFYAAAVLAFLAVGAVYYAFLHGLPDYVIKQSLLSPETDPNRTTVWLDLKTFVNYHRESLVRMGVTTFHPLWWVLFGYTLFLILAKRISAGLWRIFKHWTLILAVLSAFALHEFWLSGVAYRIYWISAFQIFWMWLVMGIALLHMPRWGRVLTCALLLSATLGMHATRIFQVGIFQLDFPLQRAQITTSNSQLWLKTVTQVTEFLKANLREDETFLALPSEQLYYFLTDKNAPTRQTEFGVQLVPQQEDEMIQAMEKGRVKYVLISNHFKNPETGMGAFGFTYGERVADYIAKHYVPVAVGGSWDDVPEWVEKHGVLIVERVPDYVQ